MTVTVPASVRPLLIRVGRLADRRGVRAYAVGGCVRDWLLGRAATPDLDVTVEGDGLGLARQVGSELDHPVTVHQQFGTATIGTRSVRLDLATCRHETYAKPGAYPRVAAGSLREDLFRRDFTINAMAVALKPEGFGALIDPYGGRRDLQRRALRILHANSFLDDPSRILRGIRFLLRFGLRWERGTEAALRDAVAAGALGWLNAGRWEKELVRMCEEPDPRACFRQLAVLLERTNGRHGRRAAAA